VLESGPATASAISDLNDGDVLGLPFTGIFDRGRGLGGGTSQWAGQCIRFHSSDFQEREWVDGSGWPIGYDDLAPFYSEAEQYFDVTADGYLARVWRDFGLEPGTMIDTDVFVRFSVFARQPQIFDRDRRRWAADPDCWLLCNATVTSLRRDGSRIDGVTVRSRDGRSLTIPSDTVVLCVGGIEVPRMLLEPMADFPAGVAGGNRHVGKHLQDHPTLVIGSLEEYMAGQGLAGVTRYLSTFYRRGRRYLPRLVLSAIRQRELNVLNACAITTFEWPAESVTQNLRELQAAVAGRRFDLTLVSRLARTLKDPRALSRTARARLRGASFGEIPCAVNLEGFVEQDPMTSSSVSLSSRSDCFGRPLAAVNWQVGERERETLLALALEIDAYLALNRIGRVVISSALRQPGDAWESGIRDNQHHVGTARMAASERHGVVDPNGKVFGLANLYVSGGAAMPTGSHANPTLTMTALGFRLAAHLARRRESCQLQEASADANALDRRPSSQMGRRC
jgi:choline dehydrogenase-like flavoprotein